MTITGEILLWRAVIDRAARDAFGCTDSSLYRHQALRWFFQKSPQSFCFVCDLAELDPDAVRDHFFKALMTKIFTIFKRYSNGHNMSKNYAPWCAFCHGKAGGFGWFHPNNHYSKHWWFCSKKCQDAFSSWRKRFSRLQPEQRECYFRPDSYYAKRPQECFGPLQLSGETRESGSAYRKSYGG